MHSRKWPPREGQDIFLWQSKFFAYATSALVRLSRDPAFVTPDSWSASAFKAGFEPASEIKASATGKLGAWWRWSLGYDAQGAAAAPRGR